MEKTTSHELRHQALDGYPIVSTVFPAQSDEFIVFGSATAVPRGFYKRFAEYARSRGINVITTDYRGIADSKQGSLKGFEMEYADWSRYDLAASVKWASERGRVWMVGHSLGGHAIGQLPDPSLVNAAYVCGVGAGWHGWMPQPERMKVWAMWNVLGPFITRALGYMPMSKFGIGEDLPMGVYRDWKHWCGFPHYFFDDPNAQHIASKFANITMPVAANVSVDDLWAPPKSRDAFFKGFVNAKLEPIDITPKQLGVNAIGHMGYFRQNAGATLWPQIIEWLAGKGMIVR
ncbi:MAG: alpha/beta hydrolase family protein [Casimicrobium sp.]